MDPLHTLLPSRSDIWLSRIFSSGAAAQAGVVTRDRAEIADAVGWARFDYELKRHGCKAVIDGNRVLIYRDSGIGQIPA